jgi:hypothetical protein
VRRAAVPLALFAFALCGCPANRPAVTFESESHGHAHERGKMLLADAGPYHAALTAHLSRKDGNELDVFFETADQEPKPVPVPLPNFTAVARTADGQEHALTFEPAPKDERKDDPDGKCSRFVAKVPWMAPDDALTVTATVPISAKPVLIVWKDFHPKKYAHHED